ncbi:MAG: transposase, partial [Desulfobacteraceae bacterium]|nr:transposase [Desulfobacteraceae bacterium]
MYKHNLKQMGFENFNLPFEERLRSDNRWVKLAKFNPWKEFEIAYAKNFSSSGVGPPAKSVRIALGALIIKEKLGTSDEETVEQIRENPYLLYFLGFTDYSDKEPFYPTMFVHFRKRFGKKAICRIIETVNQKARVTKKNAKNDDKDNNGGSATWDTSNKRHLLIVATSTPADITYPTVLTILNGAREK